MKIKDIAERVYEDGWKDGKHLMMKKMHCAFGVDWTKPYAEIEHHGKFTVNSLKKELASQGYTPDDSLILAIVQGTNSWDSGEYNVVRIRSTSFEIEVPRILDSYFRKYDFDNARKNPDCNCIFFAQKKCDLSCSSYRYEYSTWSGGYYRKIENKSDPHERVNLKLCTNSDGIVYADNYVNPDIDKSGYILNAFRNDLNGRVKAYKAEKERNMYLSTDNSDKVLTLERLINEYKERLSKEILNADTLSKVDELRDRVSWSGLYGIMQTFETFKKKTNEKSYKSITESNKDYDFVAKKCYNYIELCA